ncbi:MAG: hypothetical protein BWY72_02545 [Bacteroidetes bacterium ADurb.Bin416]|nr:MAG: hypothetical protein BWY72_02545 [Bacteroidetes bacterium ADurb.Bin416]
MASSFCFTSASFTCLINDWSGVITKVNGVRNSWLMLVKNWSFMAATRSSTWWRCFSF